MTKQTTKKQAAKKQAPNPKILTVESITFELSGNDDFRLKNSGNRNLLITSLDHTTKITLDTMTIGPTRIQGKSMCEILTTAERFVVNKKMSIEGGLEVTSGNAKLPATSVAGALDVGQGIALGGDVTFSGGTSGNPPKLACAGAGLVVDAGDKAVVLQSKAAVSAQGSVTGGGVVIRNAASETGITLYQIAGTLAVSCGALRIGAGNGLGKQAAALTDGTSNGKSALIVNADSAWSTTAFRNPVEFAGDASMGANMVFSGAAPNVYCKNGLQFHNQNGGDFRVYGDVQLGGYASNHPASQIKCYWGLVIDSGNLKITLKAHSGVVIRNNSDDAGVTLKHIEVAETAGALSADCVDLRLGGKGGLGKQASALKDGKLNGKSSLIVNADAAWASTTFINPVNLTAVNITGGTLTGTAANPVKLSGTVSLSGEMIAAGTIGSTAR
jgi:hypothetical protein